MKTLKYISKLITKSRYFTKNFLNELTISHLLNGFYFYNIFSVKELITHESLIFWYCHYFSYKNIENKILNNLEIIIK